LKYRVPSRSENLLLKTPEEDFTHFYDLLFLNELVTWTIDVLNAVGCAITSDECDAENTGAAEISKPTPRVAPVNNLLTFILKQLLFHLFHFNFIL